MRARSWGALCMCRLEVRTVSSLLGQAFKEGQEDGGEYRSQTSGFFPWAFQCGCWALRCSSRRGGWRPWLVNVDSGVGQVTERWNLVEVDYFEGYMYVLQLPSTENGYFDGPWPARLNG